MTNPILSTLQPYAPHVIPHPAGRWPRWLAAWREPQLCQCGGAFVRRKGKRGVFLGCSRYPECNGTKAAPPIPPPNTACPLCPNGQVITKTSQRGKPYKQCNGCEAFISGRFITAEEKPRVKADKAAQKEKKRIAKAKKAAKVSITPQVVQLPVDGFDYAKEWGSEWAID